MCINTSKNIKRWTEKQKTKKIWIFISGWWCTHSTRGSQNSVFTTEIVLDKSLDGQEFLIFFLFFGLCSFHNMPSYWYRPQSVHYFDYKFLFFFCKKIVSGIIYIIFGMTYDFLIFIDFRLDFRLIFTLLSWIASVRTKCCFGIFFDNSIKFEIFSRRFYYTTYTSSFKKFKLLNKWSGFYHVPRLQKPFQEHLLFLRLFRVPMIFTIGLLHDLSKITQEKLKKNLSDIAGSTKEHSNTISGTNSRIATQYFYRAHLFFNVLERLHLQLQFACSH